MKVLWGIGFFFGLMSAAPATAQEPDENLPFEKIIPGLSELNVRELVGAPMRIEPFITIRTATGDTTTYWVYPNLYTIAFKNHYVSNLEKNRVAFLKHLQNIADPKNPQGIQFIYENGH